MPFFDSCPGCACEGQFESNLDSPATRGFLKDMWVRQGVHQSLQQSREEYLPSTRKVGLQARIHGEGLPPLSLLK